MKITMLKDGESPVLGAFKKGDERLVSREEASIFISRALAKATTKKKEVKKNGSE